MTITSIEERVCESCIDAFEEEGMPRADIDQVLWLGRDIPDHICEAREDSSVRCDCPCTPLGRGRRSSQGLTSDVIDERIRDYLCITGHENGNEIGALDGLFGGHDLILYRKDGEHNYAPPFLRFYEDGRIEWGILWYGGKWEAKSLLQWTRHTSWNWRYFHENADPIVHENEFRNRHINGFVCPACLFKSLEGSRLFEGMS